MPRFYFDIRDGESFVPDEDGLEFPTINEARDDASRTLGQMMKEAMPDGGRNLVIKDWEGLKTAGEFDPTYLHVEPHLVT